MRRREGDIRLRDGISAVGFSAGENGGTVSTGENGGAVGAGAPPNLVFSGPKDKNCTRYVMPDGMTMIGGEAFKGCSGLTSIEIPNSVTKIGFWAFYGCSALETVKVPKDQDVSSCGQGKEVQVIYY